MALHRYTLRGKIGSRPDVRPGMLPGTPSKLLTAIGIYVLGGVMGWSAVGVLIAMALQ